MKEQRSVTIQADPQADIQLRKLARALLAIARRQLEEQQELASEEPELGVRAS